MGMADPSRERRDGDPEDDLDAQWADLTRRLGELRLPSDILPDEQEDAEGAQATAPPAGLSPQHVERPLGPRDYSPDPAGADLVDGFIPPDPDPLRDARPAVVLGWALTFAGLAALVLIVAIWRQAPGVVLLGAAGCIISGVALLLYQLPSERGDDPDDGAQV